MVKYAVTSGKGQKGQTGRIEEYVPLDECFSTNSDHVRYSEFLKDTRAITENILENRISLSEPFPYRR